MKTNSFILCVVALMGNAPAAMSAEPDPVQFHSDVIALHEKQIAQHVVRTEEEAGDYEGSAAARMSYVDTRYFDAASGLLLARVRRDAGAPENVHIIEVNVYENGKLVRDYGSITMPWAPKLPVRTIINLHHYNGELHSFRQFDVYGDVGYESCEGKLNGRRVRISLDGKDINETSASTPAYRACFDGVSNKVAAYINPR
jgi:hypothetical protein